MTNYALLGDVCDFLDHRRKPVAEGLRSSGPFPYYGANGQQGWIDDFLFDEPLVLLAEDGGHFGSKTKPIAYKIAGKTWVNNHTFLAMPTSFRSSMETGELLIPKAQTSIRAVIAYS
jgi:hypothetical protein